MDVGVLVKLCVALLGGWCVEFECLFVGRAIVVEALVGKSLIISRPVAVGTMDVGRELKDDSG